MTFYDINFYLLAAVIIVSAGTAVFSEKKLNILTGLFCTFMGISGLLAILNAVSLAIIYIIFFGILLTALFFIISNVNQTNDSTSVKRQGSPIFPVILIGVCTALLTGVIITTRWNLVTSGENDFSFSDMRSLIISKYSLAFIMTSVILFTVLTGAFYLLRQDKK